MKKSTEKSFGIIFSILFSLIALWPLLNKDQVRVWSIILAFIFLVLAYLKPDLLKPLNNTWIQFGEIVGKIIAPIIMAFVFFIIVTPISLLMKILGKDLLMLKFSKKNSYWIKRKENITTMDKQF
jgi:large-conductance mechanosensitive channel